MKDIQLSNFFNAYPMRIYFYACSFNSVHSSSFFKKSAVATVGKSKSRQTQVGCPESSRIALFLP